MSGSAPSVSESSPEPQIVQTKKKKSKKKSKGSVIPPHGKNPGAAEEDLTPYQPPKDSVVYSNDGDFGDFDWESVKKDEDVELWLIRVPDAVKPKTIENLKMEQQHLPPSQKSTRIGHLERKHTKYDLWDLGDTQSSDPNENESYIGGEEMRNLSCLLPRKRKDGKLYLAPKPISRHLMLSASAVVPSPESGDGPVLNQNPPRTSYPKEAFTHRFMPYGSISSKNTSSKDVEMEDVGTLSPADGSVKKKRPRESDLPKKPKKAKVFKT